MQKITLEDLEIRYRNIRKQNPRVRQCSVSGCKNPRDRVPLPIFLGEDTCCAYHRLLFDFWLYGVVEGDVTGLSQRARRWKFAHWMNNHSKDELDRIVLRMAQDRINWEC